MFTTYCKVVPWYDSTTGLPAAPKETSRHNVNFGFFTSSWKIEYSHSNPRIFVAVLQNIYVPSTAVAVRRIN